MQPCSPSCTLRAPSSRAALSRARASTPGVPPPTFTAATLPQAKEVTETAAGWSKEFSESQANLHQPAAAPAWGDEFASFQAGRAGAGPATAGGDAGPDWADQFAEGVAGDWAREFAGPATDNWQAEFEEELARLNTLDGATSSGDYVMAENNPFLTDLDSLAKGREFFCKVRACVGRGPCSTAACAPVEGACSTVASAAAGQ